jgi:putative transcriptional regulator
MGQGCTVAFSRLTQAHSHARSGYNAAMTIAHTFAGQFLIAMPSLAEPPFARGVAFLCQHGEDGAVGLLINQMSEYRLGDVLAQMKLDCDDPEIADYPVLIGGPVQQERGFVLHREPGHWDSSYRVNDDWSVTTSRDILAAMAKGEGPRRAVVTLGYAGWEAGQLEQEVMDNAWLTTRADERIVFDTPLDERWVAAARQLGMQDPSQLTGYAGHA